MRSRTDGGRNDDSARGGKGRRGGKTSADKRYEVLERVAEGTLFAVYRVRDRSEHVECALKALKGSFAGNRAFSRALAEAAEATLFLSHPNIAELDETGEEEGTLFLVEEWLPGVCLEDRLKRAPLGRAEALSFVKQIAEGLEYLHNNGVVHGDLRPSQILAATDGTLKLTEAGLWPAFIAARIALSDVQQDAAYYRAPEYGTNAAPTPASDLYSLGIILYRMLTGRVPFDGSSPLAIASRHLRDQPLPPSQWNPACPADLEALTLRLLEKNAADRYPSAAAVLEAIGIESGAAAAATAARPLPIIPSYSERLPDLDDTAGDEPGVTIPPPRGRGVTSATTQPPAQTRAPAPPEGESFDEILDERLERRKQYRREAFGALRAVIWLFVAIGVLGGVVYSGYALWIANTPATVTVPDYVNRSKSTAETMLAQKGLKLSVASEVFDPKLPADTIVKGDPPPGKQVRAGREILVTISKGEAPVPMPDLSSLDIQHAKAIIKRGGMTLGQISNQYSATVPKDYIISQFPEPLQSFVPSQPITLTISMGPQPTPTPVSPDNADNSTDDTDNAAEPESSETPPPSDYESGSEAGPIGSGPAPTSTPGAALTPRTVKVQVVIPSGGVARELSIEVSDAGGERNVYRGIHQPGEVVHEKVKILRQQGVKAKIRIYLDDDLVSEQVI